MRQMRMLRCTLYMIRIHVEKSLSMTVLQLLCRCLLVLQVRRLARRGQVPLVGLEQANPVHDRGKQHAKMEDLAARGSADLAGRPQGLLACWQQTLVVGSDNLART